MNRFQSFVAALLCLLPFASVSAEKASMRISALDGKTISIDLANKMNAQCWTTSDESSPLMFFIYTGAISFDETGRPHEAEATDNLPAGKIWFEMSVADLDNIKFSGLAGVEEITSDDGIRIDLSEGRIHVTGVDSPVELSVFSLSGMLEQRRNISADTVIDLGDLSAGMHIVTIGSNTFKILTK